MSFDTSQSSYQELRSIVSERSDSIVAWIGAGLSLTAGLPTWTGLRDSLTKELREAVGRETNPHIKKELSAAADFALVEPNLWNAFSLLKDKLGNESYKAIVRRELGAGDTVPVPSIYRTIWEMGVSGVLSLNLDRLAARAFNEVNGSKVIHSFTGSRAADHGGVLRGTIPWIANLHGTLDEVSSWILTANELRWLSEQAGYMKLIQSCFMSRTVVFVGISADDVAAGGHLESLTNLGIDCRSHFWVTHLTGEKRRWAEKVGIRIINYKVVDDDHSELAELVHDLKAFKPSDDEPVPIALKKVSPRNTLRTPEELESKSASEIRQELNAHASKILETTNPTTIGEFDSFARLYSEAIYRAWFVDVSPPKNSILGYTLTEKVAEGAFGTVFRATGEGGEQFAVKILHERIRNSREMLQSFRRGVRSMRILTDAHIHGVVGYCDASEIPAMVVMHFIEGTDLAKAVQTRLVTEWSSVLKVATELTQIIRASHKLPQRVLHRDLRPANVMLQNCWGPKVDWDDVKVLVLDFDLSYHIDAFDVSVSQPGSANGYLAPEQADRKSGVSTRNAAVDSFGLGMTLYYLRTGIEPRFAEHRYANWRQTLEDGAKRHACAAWSSLPKRFFRLILQSTCDRQEERIDMAAIEAELLRLRETLEKPSKVISAELLAEELASRALAEYKWDADHLTAIVSAGDFTVRITGDESGLQVICEFEWVQSDNSLYRTVRKWLPRAKDQIESTLKKAGWEVNLLIERGRLHGRAVIPIGKLKSNLDRQAKAIADAVGSLTLS